MKVSREQIAENRQNILNAAGRLFREHGFEKVTVAEVMKAAGLTHGGFYGYFTSKDDLIAQALANVIGGSTTTALDLDRFTNTYLSPQHCNDVAGGCPTAALGGEMCRQTPEARAAVTQGLRRQIERLASSAPGGNPSEKRQHAIGSWAAMVGAVIMARFSDDPALSEEILTQTRGWIAATNKEVK